MDARAGAHRLTPSTAPSPAQQHEAAPAAWPRTSPTPVDPDEDEPAPAVRRDLPDGQEVRPPASACGSLGAFLSARPSASRVLLAAARQRACSTGHRRSSAALLLGLLAALIVFGRRAQKAAYSQMEGQPGAAAARAADARAAAGRPTRSIAFTKQQDVVHRVVGPPGIVLVGEGNPNRLRQLMASERRKHERVAAEIPIHEVVCGNGEGEVPLPKLVAPRPEARPPGQARRDDRRPQPAQGARRPPARRSRCPRARCRPA